MEEKMSYTDQLRDPRWQHRKSEVLTKSGFQCQHCRSKTKILHVHHQWYISGRYAWEYLDSCFLCLCRDCHTAIHKQPPMMPFDHWEYAIDELGINELSKLMVHYWCIRNDPNYDPNSWFEMKWVPKPLKQQPEDVR